MLPVGTCLITTSINPYQNTDGFAFDVSPRMKDCMPIPDEEIEGPGEFGYCWMHHFKCHSRRVCTTYSIGGPITKDESSFKWQKKNKESQ